MIHDLSKKNSILSKFIREIRDSEIQKDSMRFRRNLERIGEVMAYEISQELEYTQTEIVTPLASMDVPVLKDELVLATILRAGLPLHQGLLNYFDTADSAFVTAYRKYDSADEFTVEVDYLSAPDLTEKVLIITDPMIATGSSLYKSYKALLSRGIPKKIHVVAAIASAQGISFLKKKMGSDIKIWVGAVDLELTAKAYIVPGLGDAGDLAYGNKE